MHRYPSLLQVNTRVHLNRLARASGHGATLDDLSDAELDRWARAGFQLIWLLGVWQTGERSREVSRTNSAWREEFARVLSDLNEQDIAGSSFAIQSYRVHRDFGGDQALGRLRARLAERGLGLVLDFVPNHVALDHPWLDQQPSFFITGSEAELAATPDRFVRLETHAGTRILAYGRDPNFPGWPDTLQLDYANPALCAVMRAELARVARLCDGVRCDMAMLALPEIFQRTWGRASEPFWPAAIAAVRAERPDFTFIAEAYWDLEWTLQQQGFDFTYDKRLYDRLRDGAPGPVRDHLRADRMFQDRLVRFLENHDEPRAAAVFGEAQLRAAAVIAFFTPGMRLFHQGQREGWRVRIPTHLGRGPDEVANAELAAFYDALQRCLSAPAFHRGQFAALVATRAWPGNDSHDAFVACAWSGPDAERHLIAVNYSGHAAQCYLRVPWPLASARVRLSDRLHEVAYERDGAALSRVGLYLDLPAWGYHVFALSADA